MIHGSYPYNEEHYGEWRKGGFTIEKTKFCKCDKLLCEETIQLT